MGQAQVYVYNAGSQTWVPWDGAGGGGGGGGLTQAQAQAAIEAAVNLNEIEAFIAATRDRLPAALVSGRIAVEVGNTAAIPVNPAAALAFNAGANSATTQRVTIATNDAVNTRLGTNAAAADLAGSQAAQLREIGERLMPETSIDRSIGEFVSRVVKASAGRVYSLRVNCLATSVRYFQMFNSTTAPTNGAVPVSSDTLYPNSGTGGGTLILDSFQFGGKGAIFSTGISWGISTTPLTYTAAAATDAIVIVRFV